MTTSGVRGGRRLVLMMLLLCAAVNTAHAHPMGNFSINHFARIVAGPKSIRIVYLLDFAEIPTASERMEMGISDPSAAAPERLAAAYLARSAAGLGEGVTLRVNGRPVPLAVTPIGLIFTPGAGSLPTMRLALELTAPLDAGAAARGFRVEYSDNNFGARTGWKEIIALPGPATAVSNSTVGTTDITNALIRYPTDAATAPPQQTTAEFDVKVDTAAAIQLTSTAAQDLRKDDAEALLRGSATGVANLGKASSGGAAIHSASTPRDAFTEAIALKESSVGIVLLSVLTAFGFGALHALSPGHGKAMMAAYLVGVRGTSRHAVLLGAVVTLTHTLGVFALGFVMIVAARYVVPERLYPILGGASGLIIALLGGILLRKRPRARRGYGDGGSSYGDEYGDEVQWENEAFVSAGVSDEPKPHRCADGFLRLGDYQDSAGPLSLRSLIALGITGGLIPCPSALVVMLGAVALHRAAFGIALIGAFSLGLAVVLSGIGLIVVRSRDRISKMRPPGVWIDRLPVVGAGVVTLIGIILFLLSITGRGY